MRQARLVMIVPTAPRTQVVNEKSNSRQTDAGSVGLQQRAGRQRPAAARGAEQNRSVFGEHPYNLASCRFCKSRGCHPFLR